MSDVYDGDVDGNILSEKEITSVLAVHYMFYRNMPWLMRIYYKPWIVLLDSLGSFLAPNYIARINESAGVLNEADTILKESFDEDSNS